MQRILAFGIAFAAVSAALVAQTAAPPPAPAAVIKTYCVSCHTGDAAKGGVALDPIDFDQPPSNRPAIWERVVRQLRARTMPPMTAPRPDVKTYASTIAALTDALDRGAHPTAGSLTDMEVAERLATMIWSGEPDQPLRDAAAAGKLRDGQVLQTQVRRMLADRRSSALITGFFDTWLGLDQLKSMKVDAALFPELDDELRGALRRETELFVGSQLRDDRNALDLWTADYTFVNERLARHYGVPNVSGPD